MAELFFRSICQSLLPLNTNENDDQFFLQWSDSMRKFTVLIVDDEEEFRDLTGKRLKKRGLDVYLAESGQEALETLKKNPVDVVLLDVKMPGMDGIETLRRIRTAHPQVEVVLLTGHASIDSGIEGMKFGAFDYMMKPVELEQLLEKLADANEKKRLADEKTKK